MIEVLDDPVPAGCPDFSGKAALAECSASDLRWLARQQGIAGMTLAGIEGGVVTLRLQEEAEAEGRTVPRKGLVTRRWSIHEWTEPATA